MRADEPAVIKSRTAHDSTVEASVSQVASDETRAPQVRTRKIRGIQKDVVKLRVAKVSARKINPVELRVTEHQSGEHAFFARSKDPMQRTIGT